MERPRQLQMSSNLKKVCKQRGVEREKISIPAGDGSSHQIPCRLYRPIQPTGAAPAGGAGSLLALLSCRTPSQLFDSLSIAECRRCGPGIV